jgi:excisionase family DNA binding protein
MIDPSEYFGPAPEKPAPETEEEKVAAFKAIKAKLAATDPLADINHIVRRAQKQVDGAKTIPTKAKHLGLALGDLEILKEEYKANHTISDFPIGSEEYFAAIDFIDAADIAIARMRQDIARLELEAENADSPEPTEDAVESPTEAEAQQFPEQMDAEEVARYLHRSKDVIYRYAREGRIPTIWIDTHPLFSKKDIDEWLSHNKKPLSGKKPR